jgi:hypothetical protein
LGVGGGSVCAAVGDAIAPTSPAVSRSLEVVRTIDPPVVRMTAFAVGVPKATADYGLRTTDTNPRDASDCE